MLFTSSRSRPASLPTTTSTSPSLSMSPNAAPRPDSDNMNAAPARSVTFSNRPLPRLRDSTFRWSYGNGWFDRRSLATIVPFTMSRSSHPSLSKSNHAVPQPVYGRLNAPSDDAALASRNLPDPSLTYRLAP